MPHPASSGTGYLMVAAWLQMMGEKDGWAFMDGLHENIAAYLHSGSAPCVQAARGERVAGLALDMRGASEKTKGAPHRSHRAQGRHGLGHGGPAIVKGTKNLARRQEDRRLGRDQGRERALFQDLRGRGLPGVGEHPAELPGDTPRRA